MRRLGTGFSRVVIMMALLLMVFSSCSTSGEDVFAEFETRNLTDSSDSAQSEQSVTGIVFNLGDTIMEYEVEELGNSDNRFSTI